MSIRDIVLSGVKVGLITKAVNGLSTFVLMYFINKNQGTEFYGSMMIITATALLASSLFNPGVKFVCLREMSVANDIKTKSFWAIWGLFFSISISLFLSAIFIPIYKAFATVDNNILYGILIAPLMVAINYNNYISREYSLTNYTLINMALPISMLLIYFCMVYRADIASFLLVMYSCIIAFIVQLFFIAFIEKDFIKKIGKDFFFNIFKNFKIIFKKSSQLAVGDSVSIMAPNIFIVMANFLGFQQESIGLYTIAQKISAVIMTLSMQIKTFLMPEMSKLSAQSKSHEINIYGRVISKLSTIITIVSCFFSIMVLKIFYKELSLEASSVSVLISIVMVLHAGYIVDAWVGPVGMVARLLGGEYFQNFVMIISLLLSILIFSLFHANGLITLSIVASLYVIVWNLGVMTWLKINKNILFCWGVRFERT